MSRRAMYPIEKRIQAAERVHQRRGKRCEYSGRDGNDQKWQSTIAEWAAIYRENGIERFHIREGNERHTSEKKKQAVEEYLQGRGSLREICRKYHISRNTTLRRWIKVYHSNRELRDYDPKPEVYVAMRKKTTKEERREIVAYCLEHGKNYKETAERYEVSYNQIYQWVRHYEARAKQVWRIAAESVKAMMKWTS